MYPFSVHLGSYFLAHVHVEIYPRPRSATLDSYTSHIPVDPEEMKPEVELACGSCYKKP
jgi:hypothetical protein